MMSYINETDFVIENKKLVYPEIVTDGLQLYYDAKGKRDTDYHRDTMLDMSGNKNHGKLYNFAYEKHSGYKDGLVFDYIDDKLVRPTLDLQPDDFTFMLNGNIISFSPDGTVKRVQDGEVIESKGFNLVRNGNFSEGLAGWSVIAGTLSLTETEYNSFPNSFYKPTPTDALYRDISLPNDHIIYLSAFVKGTNKMELRMHQYKTWTRIKVVTIESSSEWTLLSLTGLSTNGGIRIDTSVSDGENYYDDFIAIDLTETFGEGNEPTKEQMDEIVNRFGFIPNAQDLIDHIEYKGNDLGDMENIIDGLYKTEVLSGEEIYTDKADDAVVHVDVDGKSYQHAGSGKNLITNDPKYWEIGSVNGTPNSGVNFPQTETLRSPYIELKKGSYTLSVFNNTGNYSVIDNWFHTYDSNKKGIGALGWSSALSRIVEIPEDGCFVRVLIRPNPRIQVSLSDVSSMFNIQLEEGSTVTAYEPPAPTPDYPIEIHNLNDFDVVSSGVGRNYVLSSDFSDGWNNWLNSSGSRGTFVEYDTYPGKKFLRIDNSDGALSNPFVQSYTSVGEAGKYTLSWLQKGTGNVIIQNASEENGNLTPRVQGIFTGDFSRHSLTLDIEEGNPKARIVFQSFDGHDISVTNVKLEKGNKATSWTPAPEDIIEDSNHPLIDKINLLLDEPLRSVGDVKDRLFRDSDGLWKIGRNVEEVSLADLLWSRGSETSGWKQDGITTAFYTYGLARDGNMNQSIAPIVSHFKTYTDNRLVPRDEVGFTTGGVINYSTIRIPKRTLTEDTVPSVKLWMQENGVKIQYVTKIPITETLSQNMQDKLNNLRSFEDSNYIYTVLNKSDISTSLSDNLKPTLHTKFLYNNWYKEDRVINNLMIYNRALTNEEMLQNYKTIKRRWGM